MKKCSKCRKVKPYTKFVKHKHTKDGYYCYCKECKKEVRVYKQYGITKACLQELKEIQKNKCFICNKKESIIHKGSKKRQELTIDHCHKTDKVRGLLCKSCNIGLGEFKDNIKNLEKAIYYLEINNAFNKK